MKPFDLDAAKRGKKIVTRDGREVKFVAHVPEADANYRVVAMESEGVKIPMAFSETGACTPDMESSGDLFMAPPKDRVVWVNFHDDGYAYHFDTEEAAEKAAGLWLGLLARAVPVTISVEE